MNAIDETHDSKRTSWVPGADGHPDFPVQNLPFGIFAPAGGEPRPGVAIGDRILDLRAASAQLPKGIVDALAGSTLNALFARPQSDRIGLRRCLSELLSDDVHRTTVEPGLHLAADCTLHLPCAISDYTDFYIGIHHANNVGKQFRPDNPLLPNYKHIPIGYHGRASSVRPSGIDLIRPRGQCKAPNSDVPHFGPTRRLDYELELGVWVGEGNMLGSAIPITQAPAHIAGFTLLNDWSARDMQAWEYQPLGPFLAKNFHTSVSPWVVTPQALAPFRIAQPPRPEGDPRPLSYLWDAADQQGGALDLTLEVYLTTAAMRDRQEAPHRLSCGPASSMYWTVAQIVAHHASNGCNLQPGDLLGTGTLSAPTPDGFGSLMEITRSGAEPIVLSNGEVRGFLEDGDEIMMTARATCEGFVSIGFGPCLATVLPSIAA